MTEDITRYRHAFDAALEVRESDDGRHYVTGRVVPFGLETPIAEPDASGQVVTYREQFLPGCLDYQSRQLSPDHWYKVAFRLGHSDRLEREVGCAAELEERDDGVYGRFKLARRGDIDHVLSMLEDSYRGLSVEFINRKSDLDGVVVSRRSVWIAGVAATPMPAYAGALVTGVREAATVDLHATPNLDRVRAELDALRAAVTPPA